MHKVAAQRCSLSLKEAKMWQTPKTFSPSRAEGPRETFSFSARSFLGAMLPANQQPLRRTSSKERDKRVRRPTCRQSEAASGSRRPGPLNGGFGGESAAAGHIVVRTAEHAGALPCCRGSVSIKPASSAVKYRLAYMHTDTSVGMRTTYARYHSTSPTWNHAWQSEAHPPSACLT
jgi:hypothetical protein